MGVAVLCVVWSIVHIVIHWPEWRKFGILGVVPTWMLVDLADPSGGVPDASVHSVVWYRWRTGALASSTALKYTSRLARSEDLFGCLSVHDDADSLCIRFDRRPTWPQFGLGVGYLEARFALSDEMPWARLTITDMSTGYRAGLLTEVPSTRAKAQVVEELDRVPVTVRVHLLDTDGRRVSVYEETRLCKVYR